jgi:uncharacterized protein (DUF1501 family)
MNPIDFDKHTRRAFVQRSASLALVAGTATPFAVNLATLGEAAAFNATDYKALVCVFLQGGSDYAHTVVPYDMTSYAKYAKIRGVSSGSDNLVIGRTELGATVLKPTVALGEGRQYALNPNMTGLADLFNRGVATVQFNVGPLVMPITRAQYQSGNTAKYPIPPKLFSHNDQVSVWQSYSAEGATEGWGGRIGDIALAGNNGSVFTCISLTGNSVFLAGRTALQYQCAPGGAIPIEALNPYFLMNQTSTRDWLANMIQQSSSDPFENEYAKVVRRAISSESQISKGLSKVLMNTTFPSGSNLSDQLKTVARLIAARESLGVKRQVFMVSIGGFDLHDNLVTNQPGLLKQVSEAITSFYNATEELGVANNVTTFTASDFGRTLTPNGDGSDHGWGSHHFVVGGAVKGAAFYGTPPPISVGDTSAPEDQWHVGQGRLLPSTSVEQYAATLAKWFGVADTELYDLLPYLKNFGSSAGFPNYPTNLGFLG